MKNDKKKNEIKRLIRLYNKGLVDPRTSHLWYLAYHWNKIIKLWPYRNDYKIKEGLSANRQALWKKYQLEYNRNQIRYHIKKIKELK